MLTVKNVFPPLLNVNEKIIERTRSVMTMATDIHMIFLSVSLSAQVQNIFQDYQDVPLCLTGYKSYIYNEIKGLLFGVQEQNLFVHGTHSGRYKNR